MVGANHQAHCTVEYMTGGLQRRVVPADHTAIFTVLQDTRRNDIPRAHPWNGLLQFTGHRFTYKSCQANSCLSVLSCCLHDFFLSGTVV